MSLRRKSQGGFTLVETILAVGISSAAALVVFKVMDQSNTGLRMVENREDNNQLHREVISRMSDRTICTFSLAPGMAGNEGSFTLPALVNERSEAIVPVPFTQGRVTLTELRVKSIDKNAKRAEILATYSQKIKNREIVNSKTFHAELSYDDDKFQGCISRGSLVMDPKEACELVVGFTPAGGSYFENGICDFPRASCEQSGRVWNAEFKRCDFSEADLESLRQEICRTLGFDYSPERSMCLPTQAHLDMMEKLGIKKNQE